MVGKDTLSNPAQLIPFLNKKLFKQGDCYSPGTGFCVKKDFYVYLAPADLSIDLLEKEDVFVFNEMLDENGQPSVHQAPENKDLKISSYSKIYLHLLEEFSCNCVLICQTQPSTLIGDFYCDKVVFSQREWLTNFPVRFGSCQDRLKFNDKLQIPIIQYKTDQDELISDIIDALYSNMPTCACIIKGFGLVVLGDSWMNVRNMFQVLKELFNIELSSLQYRVRGSINQGVTKMSHQITELATSHRIKAEKLERDSQLASINHQELFREYLISPDIEELSEENLQVDNDLNIENDGKKENGATKEASEKQKSGEKSITTQENINKSNTNPPKSQKSECSKVSEDVSAEVIENNDKNHEKSKKSETLNNFNVDARKSMNEEDTFNDTEILNDAKIDDLEQASATTDGEEVMEELIETVQQMEKEALDYYQLDDCADLSLFKSIKYEPNELKEYQKHILHLTGYRGNIKLFKYGFNRRKKPFVKKRICYLMNCINKIGIFGMFLDHDLTAVLNRTRKTFGCRKCKTCKGETVEKDSSVIRSNDQEASNTTLEKDDDEKGNYPSKFSMSNMLIKQAHQNLRNILINSFENVTLVSVSPEKRKESESKMLQYLLRCLDAIFPNPESDLMGTSIESIKSKVRHRITYRQCAACKYKKFLNSTTITITPVSKPVKLDNFKLKIISLVTEQNMTPKDVGEQHGIHEDEIIKWVNSASQTNPSESSQPISNTTHNSSTHLGGFETGESTTHQTTSWSAGVETDRQSVVSCYSDNTCSCYEEPETRPSIHSDQHRGENSEQHIQEKTGLISEILSKTFIFPKSRKAAMKVERQNQAIECAAREAVQAYLDNSPLPNSHLNKGSIKCMKILAQIEKHVSNMERSQEFKDEAIEFFHNIYGFDSGKMSRYVLEKRKLDQYDVYRTSSGYQNKAKRSKPTEEEGSSSKISATSS